MPWCSNLNLTYYGTLWLPQPLIFWHPPPPRTARIHKGLGCRNPRNPPRGYNPREGTPSLIPPGTEFENKVPAKRYDYTLPNKNLKRLKLSWNVFCSFWPIRTIYIDCKDNNCYFIINKILYLKENFNLHSWLKIIRTNVTGVNSKRRN